MLQQVKKCAVAAFALAASFGLVGKADASYTYSTAIVLNGASTSGSIVNTTGTGATFTSTAGTQVTLQDITNPGSFIVGNPLSPNIGNVGVTTTSAASDSFTLNYTDTITITNNGGTPTTAFVITGTLTFSGIMNSNGSFAGTVSNLYNPPFNQGPTTINGATFTANFGNGTVNDLFGPPTIGQAAGATGSGSLGANINSTVVPEPASVIMLGLGLAGLGVVSARRRRLA